MLGVRTLCFGQRAQVTVDLVLDSCQISPHILQLVLDGLKCPVDWLLSLTGYSHGLWILFERSRKPSKNILDLILSDLNVLLMSEPVARDPVGTISNQSTPWDQRWLLGAPWLWLPHQCKYWEPVQPILYFSRQNLATPKWTQITQ